MSLPNELLPVGLLATGDTQYRIERSLRFNSADSAYCGRTVSSANTSNTTATLSWWAKRSKLGVSGCMFSGYDGSSSYATYIEFDAGDTLQITNPSYNIALKTTQVFRDPSSWYHFVLIWDTSNATSTDRYQLYVNGSRITTFSTAVYPSQNDTGRFIYANANNRIGTTWGSSGYSYFDGYLADIHFIDGQALTPSSFAETNTTTGQWVPKAYTGTYGTNGFRLAFADNSSNTATTLGKDSSGNGNNWTPNNLSTSAVSPISVASATGALPILNTTGTYGETVADGVRSDSFASSIACAVPLGTAAGLNLTDQSPTGRVSATKTVTNNSSVNNTSITKFYSGSLYIDGASGTRLYVDGFTSFASNYSTNFTIECWFYPVSITNNARIPVFHNDRASVPGTFGVYWDSSGFFATGVTGSYSALASQWYHVAYVRNGSTNTLYIDGVAALTGTASPTTAAAYAYLILGNRIVSDSFDYRGQAYYSDLRAYESSKYTGTFVPVLNPQQANNFNKNNDSLVDTPTSYGTDTGAGGSVRGNYCTLNPLKQNGATLSNGNLDVSITSSTANQVHGTIGVSSGKWYWEVTPTNSPTGAILVGVAKDSAVVSTNNVTNGNAWLYYGFNGQKYNTSGTSYGATFGNGDVIGVALDLDAGTLTFYKNGTTQGQAFTGLTGTLVPLIHDDESLSSKTAVANFGQRPFAYTAPSGFKALCDTNLPAPVVAKPNTAFDVLLYTGNGSSSRAITGLQFSPDFIWGKERNSTNWHNLVDIVRGASKRLYSNSTIAEEDVPTSFISFDSGGFTIGNDNATNENNAPYVAWCWDAGSSTTTNTQGSITSSVRANPSAGFSIVSYSGTGSSGTIGHGLGVAPAMIITKCRTNVGGTTVWGVWHKDLSGANPLLRLNATTETQQYDTVYQPANNTSQVWGVGNELTVNAASNTYIAYVWTSLAGYSSFGRYIGNGSAGGGGPFAYTGFRPAWILVKRTDSTGSWYLIDNKRNGYNVDPNGNKLLYPDLANAEASIDWDILSNGFKMRDAGPDLNANGGTYVYAAFAENPFQYARAR